MVARKYVFFVEDVPSQWIFEHYLNLTEKLTGQSLKILSIFKTEKTPSMCIYVGEKSEYMFKDFSSSKGGNGVALVAELYGLNYKDAAMRIKSDYENYINNEDLPVAYAKSITAHSRYKVAYCKVRSWNTADAAYWTKFGISSEILDEYNVKPLEYYVMKRMDSQGNQEKIQIERHGIYGYFTQDGILSKIYQPGLTSKKFIKVANYIQGSDQLKGKKYLMICSSLKDAMAIVAMKFNHIDVIAPDSENTMLPDELLKEFKSKYEAIFTILDDDVAGIKAMHRYKEEYGINYVHLQMSKDVSDSVRDYGLSNVRIVIYNTLVKLLK